MRKEMTLDILNQWKSVTYQSKTFDFIAPVEFDQDGHYIWRDAKGCDNEIYEIIWKINPRTGKIYSAKKFLVCEKEEE